VKGIPDDDIADFRCANCGDGVLTLVDAESETPLFFCSNCNHYRGSLLGRGQEVYYDTRLLRVAQALDTKMLLETNLVLPLKGALEALAYSLNDELGFGWEEVFHALRRLERSGLLRLEERPEGMRVVF